MSRLLFLFGPAVLAALLNGAAGAQTVTTLVNSLNGSGDLSVGPDGNIYVADFGQFLNSANGTTVSRVTPDGQVSVFATGLSGASGNEFDAQGNLIQANIAANRVDRIAPDGTVTTIAQTGFTSPVGIAIAADGTVYVANCGGNSISRIDNGAGVVFASGGALSCPNGLTMDPEGNLYAANFNNGNVIRITPDGSQSVLATTPNSSFRPSGGNGHITFGNGRLYLVSNASAQVFELTLDGVLTVVAGDGSRGHNDGPGDQASFSSPNGISLSADGRFLYVNEASSTAGTTLNFATFPLNPSLVRVVDLGPQSQPVQINNGMTGAWFNPATPGQGMYLDVSKEANLLFGAWFTYETNLGFSLPPGANEHRWLTFQGPFSGEAATVEVFLTEGGIFDDAALTTTTAVGQVTISFSTCTDASFAYALDAGPSGSMELIRLTPDLFCGATGEKR
ncbi:MAG: hypothetical protein QNJ40_14415 [Xanthomonadales bacterium]|nr:hypothetical protein [Xanthomonadales bacterium]